MSDPSPLRLYTPSRQNCIQELVERSPVNPLDKPPSTAHGDLYEHNGLYCPDGDDGSREAELREMGYVHSSVISDGFEYFFISHTQRSFLTKTLLFLSLP